MRYQNFVELRAVGDSRVIEGRAVVFNSISRNIGMYEMIESGAITQDVINNSDILFTYNHERNKVLARSCKGSGTLNVELREDGVYFNFEAPNTTLGNDVLEEIRRGDLNKCSFAFDLPRDDEHRSLKRQADGSILRTIKRIDVLHDLSAVFEPAYDDTYLAARSAEDAMDEEELKNTEENTEEETKSEDEMKSEDMKNPVEEEKNCNPDEEKNCTPDEEKQCEETPDEEKNCNPDEEKSDDYDESENEPEGDLTGNEEETNENDNEEREENCEEERSINTKNKNSKKHNIMEFSFIKTINDVLANRGLNEAAAAVNAKGVEQMRAAGLAGNASFTLPYETRADITVAAEGEDTVATEIFDVLGPLRAKNVLAAAGAKFLTGLQGDVQIPRMSASDVTWKGEVAAADDGAGVFDSVTFSPKRLTAKVTLSRQFIMQQGCGAEELIRRDIVDAINSKLEATLLSADAKTATKPAGIFNGMSLGKTATYADLANAEADLETAGIVGELKYIVSPKMKATLRTTQKGNGVGFVMENGAIDGVEALSTAHVTGKKLIVGDWSNYCICSWGGVEVVVDPYSKAANDEVVLVISAYFDAKPLRDNVFAGIEVTA